MVYKATFQIDCGVSSGLGSKSPESLQRTEDFVADTHQAAYQRAMRLANGFADDYLSNPVTNLTIVQLLSLRCYNPNPPFNSDVSFDVSKSVAQRSTLEHLLSFAS